MSLYVDARLITSSRAQSGRVLYPTLGTFVIGAYADLSQTVMHTLNGMLDDVAIWSGSVGPQAVALMYATHRNSSVFICPTCPPGMVSTAKCQGEIAVDCQPVYACPRCRAGERMSAPCENPGSLAPITCVPCSALCAMGQRILASSLCTGSGWADIECVSCRETCSIDQYLVPSCTNGTGFFDTRCTACHACRNGQYISTGCDGSTSSDVKKCSNCTTACSPGEILQGNCDGSEYQDAVVCTACPLGTYSHARNATACLDCAEGYFSDVRGASSCSACMAGTYSEPGSTACLQCSEWQCGEGDWRSVCTGRRRGNCLPMPTWTQLPLAGNSLPPLSKHSMTVLPNGVGYVFGGQIEPGRTRSNSLYRIEMGSTSVPIAKFIQPTAGTTAPVARDSHAMASIDDGIFVSGGLAGSSTAGGTYMNDFWVLLPPGNWSLRALASLPERMAGHKMVGTPDGLLWLFGGKDASGQAIGKLYYINMRNLTRTWIQYTVPVRANLATGANTTVAAPTPRWDFGMVSQGYRIYVSALS
jgi:hypothetical protein